MRFPGMHLCFTGEPFPGVLNGRRSSHFPPRKVSMLPLLMQQRRASGLGPSSPNFSLESSTPPLYFPTTSQQSPSPRTTSITLAPNISTFVSILFATSSKTVLFVSFTALQTTWSQTCSPRPSPLQRSSILHRNLDLPHLEGECWNSKVRCPRTFHHFPVYLSPPFLWIKSLTYNSFPLLLLYSITTRDTYTARVLVPVATK
jgi:hypothetical protein